METIKILKEKGNVMFSKGAKKFPDDDCSHYFKEACIYYGQAIEKLMELESDDSYVERNDGFHLFKPTLFLNLAAANLKLNSFEGCRRCCNSCLVFCNNPILPLASMGIDDDITIDVGLQEPVLPSHIKLACKALFRRGKCYSDMGNMELAVRDFMSALRLSPDEIEIIEAVANAKSALKLIASR